MFELHVTIGGRPRRSSPLTWGAIAGALLAGLRASARQRHAEAVRRDMDGHALDRWRRYNAAVAEAGGVPEGFIFTPGGPVDTRGPVAEAPAGGEGEDDAT